jgi:hypothetical protein
MTPAQQQAARIEKDVAATEIGRKVQSGELATHDPSKYVVIPKDTFLTPLSDGDDVKDAVELTITIPVTVAWDWEEDDDGCGPASRTGNSMTGRRGRYKSVVAASVTPEDLEKAVGEALSDYADNVELD